MSDNTESETILLNKADLLKAYSEGCSTTKKVLENLYPKVFDDSKWPEDVITKRYCFIGVNGPDSNIHKYEGELFMSASGNIDKHGAFILRITPDGGWMGLYEGAKKYMRPIENATAIIKIVNGKIDAVITKEE